MVRLEFYGEAIIRIECMGGAWYATTVFHNGIEWKDPTLYASEGGALLAAKLEVDKKAAA